MQLHGAVDSNRALSGTDLVAGTALAVVMATAFTLLSSGSSLLITFVPGVAFAWAIYVWIYVKRIELPAASAFLPVFFITLAVQFLHFAEEFTTGFRIRFPVLYGGAPYSEHLFVIFNMISYCMFTLACVLVFTRKVRFLLVPVLFFIVYGAIGNAITHTWWSLHLRSYFPGVVTAQLYWVAGPVVLRALVGSSSVVFTIVVLFALTLVPLLAFFAQP